MPSRRRRKTAARKHRNSFDITPSSWDEDSSGVSVNSPPSKRILQEFNQETFLTPNSSPVRPLREPSTGNVNIAPSSLMQEPILLQSTPSSIVNNAHLLKPTQPSGDFDMGSMSSELLQDLKANLVSAVKEDLIAAVRKDIVETIAREFRKEFQCLESRMSDLESKIQLELTSYKDGALSFEHKVTKQTKDIEQRVHQLEERKPATETFSPDTSIIVRNVPYHQGENVLLKAEMLVSEGLQLDKTTIVRAERTKMRDGKPGIVKVQFRDLDSKISALRKKKQLQLKPKFHNVFLNSAKSHEERLIELNTKELLKCVPGGDKYRLTGSGRLIMKQGDYNRQRVVDDGNSRWADANTDDYTAQTSDRGDSAPNASRGGRAPRGGPYGGPGRSSGQSRGRGRASPRGRVDGWSA